jgi:antitoxin component of MazEF toxin-antitoxin module
MTITIPDELIQQLGWSESDKLDIQITMDCYDWGETQSLLISNITKTEKEKQAK